MIKMFNTYKEIMAELFLIGRLNQSAKIINDCNNKAIKLWTKLNKYLNVQKIGEFISISKKQGHFLKNIINNKYQLNSNMIKNIKSYKNFSKLIAIWWEENVLDILYSIFLDDYFKFRKADIIILRIYINANKLNKEFDKWK